MAEDLAATILDAMRGSTSSNYAAHRSTGCRSGVLTVELQLIRLFAANVIAAALLTFGVARATAQSAPVASRPSFAQSPSSQPASPTSAKWESAIAEFEASDRKNSTPENPVLFVGSSSIVGWDTARAFPELPVLNRGFGGSMFRDATHFADRVIVNYRPRAIVLYSGDNDAAEGLTAAQISEAFADLLARVRRDLPVTPMVVISIKPSMARWQRWPTMKEANRLIAERCKQDETLRFVDVASPMLAADGVPRSELFQPDRLHLNDAGYAIWNEIVRRELASLLPRGR